MRDDIIGAFEKTHCGYSADRVIADRSLQINFLCACRKLGIQGSDEEINLKLLNLRKASDLNVVVTSKKTQIPNASEATFAAEVAARFLERKYKTSLDRILCSPRLSEEFDSTASELQPGFVSLEYRWAALRLRKTSKLRPELAARVMQNEIVQKYEIPSLDLTKIPTCQGIYCFITSDSYLYVGESTNLRKRLSKHLEHSDNKDLARWFWEHGAQKLFLELHVLPIDTTSVARRAVELELIRSRNPVFNIKR